MIYGIGLTFFILTVAFYSCNCSDDFDKKFSKIGSYGEKKLIELNYRVLTYYFSIIHSRNQLKATEDC